MMEHGFKRWIGHIGSFRHHGAHCEYDGVLTNELIISAAQIILYIVPVAAQWQAINKADCMTFIHCETCAIVMTIGGF